MLDFVQVFHYFDAHAYYGNDTYFTLISVWSHAQFYSIKLNLANVTFKNSVGGPRFCCCFLFLFFFTILSDKILSPALYLYKD